MRRRPGPLQWWAAKPMEASALPRSAALPRPRLVVPAPLLRVRSDEQLVVLFRAGSDDAFRTIHDRYRARLLAYARQMLGGSTADAEDVLQEVFVRAHAALLASSTPISLRAWLYRIAHNRCIDTLRRPAPIPSEITPGARPALCRGHRHDPPVEAERSEDLRRLIGDVHSLPEQQRSALLMRELQGLSYEEMAVALGISVAAVKSVLLRARGGVLDAVQARDAPCADIRVELVSAHDRGVRASGRARRHLRDCDRCCAYRGELRAVRRQVAGLVPAGPLGHLGLIFGLGGGGAGAGAGGGLAAGGSTAVFGGAAGVTATKVAALVCCAALVGSAGALRAGDAARAPARPGHAAARAAAAAAATRPAVSAPSGDPRTMARIAGGTIGPAALPAGAAPAPGATGQPSAPSLPALTGQDSYGAPGAAGAAGGSPLRLDAAGAGPASSAGGAAAAATDASTPAPGDTTAPGAAGTAPQPAGGGASAPGTAAAPAASASATATATAPASAPQASASNLQTIDQRRPAASAPLTASPQTPVAP